MPPDPAGSKQIQPGLDGSTWYGYTGPCPQSAQIQSYLYTAHALKVPTLPTVTPQSSGKAVDTLIQANELTSASLTAMAGR
jgi:phosphatidylethanolamine-binding protein (PEBP) family uncharacterized protein